MPLTPLVAPLVLMGVAMPLHESPFFFSSRGWNLCSYNVLIHSHVIINYGADILGRCVLQHRESVQILDL